MNCGRPEKNFKTRRLLSAVTALIVGNAYVGWSKDDGRSVVAPLKKATAPAVVSNVDIQGIVRVDPEMIQHVLGVHKGDQVTPYRLNQALKDLFATGLFEDVHMNVDVQGVLRVRVKENRIINQITFEGNSAVKKEVLEAAISIKPRDLYTPAKVYENVHKLKTVYAYKNYPFAVVVPKLIERPQNRVDLIFTIQEGSKIVLKNIIFQGNEHFTDHTLKSVITTEESVWYRFWSSSDIYDVERVDYDISRLREFYANNGFMDAVVHHAVAELVGQELYLTFRVEEGARYRVQGWEFDIKLPLSEEIKEKLQSKVTSQEGGFFSPKDVERSVDAMLQALQDEGISFVSINPSVRKNAQDNTVSITFEIEKAPPIYVNRIIIENNSVTEDSVIRREMTVFEGSMWHPFALQKSEQKLKNLDFFEQVTITTERTDDPAKKDIRVSVKEQPTGSAKLSGGYGANDGPFIQAHISENNFMGKGYTVGAEGTYGSRNSGLNLAFFDPYFWHWTGNHVGWGVNVFYSRYNGDTRGSSVLKVKKTYSQNALGIKTHFSYDWTPWFYQTVGYTLRRDRLRISHISAQDKDKGASSQEKDFEHYWDELYRKNDTPMSPYIQRDSGKYWVSMIRNGFVYDRRNRFFQPTRGYDLRYSQEMAGLGGNVAFLRQELSSAFHYPLDEDETYVTTVRGFFGWLVPVKKNSGQQRRIRITDTYFAGGVTFPGFQNSGIGPVDFTTRDHLGGRYFGKVDANVMAPFPLIPKEWGVNVGPFVVAGSLWKPVTGPLNPRHPVLSANSFIRVSAGVKLSVFVPFLGGHLSVYFAQPLRYLKKRYVKVGNTLKRHKVDKPQRFLIDFGMDF